MNFVSKQTVQKILKKQIILAYIVGFELPLLKYVKIYEVTVSHLQGRFEYHDKKLRSFHEVAAGGQGPLFFTAHLVLQTVVLNGNPLYKYVGSCKFAQQRSEKLFLEDTIGCVSIGNPPNMTLYNLSWKYPKIKMSQNRFSPLTYQMFCYVKMQRCKC